MYPKLKQATATNRQATVFSLCTLGVGKGSESIEAREIYEVG